MGLLSEFRDFAVKGNAIDLAVGVIIGGAFGTIVKSVTDDLIMPFVGIFGKADFSSYWVPLKPAGIEKWKEMEYALTPEVQAAVRAAGSPVLTYGNFVTVLVNFLILAFIIFMMIKAMNRLRKPAPAAAPAAPPPPPADVVLLQEIRDLLKTR